MVRLTKSLRRVSIWTSLALILAMFAGTQPIQAASAASWVSVSAGYQHTCAIDTAQRVSCWGNNDSGQLGNGSFDTVEVPAVIQTTGALSAVKFQQVSASYSHTCALSTDGLAYCWGSNDQGQLGNPDITTSTNVPVPVNTTGALSGVVLTEIDTGYNHTCALDTTGKAYCWGANDNGQLGDGTRISRPSPTAIDTSGALNAKVLSQISAGSLVTCALDTAGKAYCWGYGPDGQIGDGLGRSLNRVPTAVDTSSAIGNSVLNQINVGDSSVCALDAAGDVYCWGLNDQGQLGDGTNDSALSPVQFGAAGVLVSGKPVSVILGGTFACSLTDAGYMGCWGDGTLGQLGNADTTTSNTPVDVAHTGASVLKGIVISQLSSGFAHTCGVSTTHHLICWGFNATGQLGTGADTSVATGIPVLALDPPIPAPELIGSDQVTVAGVVGQLLTATDISEQVSGDTLDYNKKSGTLAPGIAIGRADGILTGTPTASGTFNSVINVSNAGGSKSISLSLVISQTDPNPSPPSDSTVIVGSLGTSGTTTGLELTADGVLHPKLTTGYAGPMTGTAAVTYRNLTTNKYEKFNCVFAKFGQLKAVKPAKKNTKKLPKLVYRSKAGCQMPPIVRQTLAQEKIRILIKLHFERRWPFTYKLKTPTGKKIRPINYSVMITAGAGKSSN